MRSFTSILFALALAACTVSPLPDPPTLAPVNPNVVIVNPGCSPDPEISSACDGGFHISGRQGAAEPGTIVWAVNLDRPFAPVTDLVDADGSFDVATQGNVEDEVRLQLRADGLRSNPVDVRGVAIDDTVVLAVRPLADCLVADPPFELLFGQASVGTQSVETITIANDCSAAALVDAVNLRAPTTAFILRSGPMMIGPGSSATVEVEFAPDDAMTFEEVLLIEIATPERDRRPITLVGIGTD